jgi:hypothetical protein
MNHFLFYLLYTFLFHSLKFPNELAEWQLVAKISIVVMMGRIAARLGKAGETATHFLCGARPIRTKSNRFGRRFVSAC